MCSQRTDTVRRRRSGETGHLVRRPIEALGRAIERLHRRLSRRGPHLGSGPACDAGAGGGPDDDLLDEMAIW